jgi:hypothetical protein
MLGCFPDDLRLGIKLLLLAIDPIGIGVGILEEKPASGTRTMAVGRKL